MATITLQEPVPVGKAVARQFTGRITGNSYTISPNGQVTIDTRDIGSLITKGWRAVAGSGNQALSASSTIDFGAFPGSGFASVTIAAIDAGDPNAVLYGYVAALATADHSADEHLVDPPMVTAVSDGAGNVVISGVSRGNDLMVPPVNSFGRTQTFTDAQPMPYGKWSVGYTFLQ